MGTTADKLNNLINTKECIRQEINRAYGTDEVSTSDTFNSYTQKLKEHPFYIVQCIEKSIENIKSPDATSIGDYTFYDCNSLTSVDIPNATSVGYMGFSKCTNLTSVNFPNVTEIDTSAFKDCTNLSNINFPNVTKVSNSAFENCTSLISANFPNVTRINSNTFHNCTNLTSVNLPNSTIIDFNAFQNCSKLSSIDSPEVTDIDSSVFENCTSLSSINFPNVTRIGNFAFSDCTNLSTAIIGTNTSTVCISDYGMFSGCTNLASIYVPFSLVDKYKSDTYWSEYADKIKEYEQPIECITLSITADNVKGNSTSTTVHYTAECTYTKEGVTQPGTKIFIGEGISSPFAQNTSTTSTVQRTISFTFYGKTATTTITQGVWINPSINVTLKAGMSDYGWRIADSEYNVDGYDVYMTDSNYDNTDYGTASMSIHSEGYTKLTLYIRSYSSWEGCTMASYPNVANPPDDEHSSDTFAYTEYNQSGTELNYYTAVNYNGLSGDDIIYITHKKMSDSVPNTDRGYLLIPKQP